MRIPPFAMLMLARPGAPHPNLRYGNVALVLYETQDPVEVVIVSDEIEHGWVWVEEDYMNDKIRYQVLASCCVLVSDLDQPTKGTR